MITAERRATLTAKAESYIQHVDQAEAYLTERGLSMEAAYDFGFGVVPEGHEYAGRLSIPYWTPNGVVSIKYRDMGGNSKHKYLYEAGAGTHLYNASALIYASDRAVLTEGELDAVAVQSCLKIPAAAYPGVDRWRKHYHFRICFEGIPEVLVVADGDDVGQQAAAKVAEDIGYAARVVRMPDGEDANSFIHKHGAQAFLERLEA